MRRKMHDRVTASEHACQFCGIQNVDYDGVKPFNRFAVTGRKIVVDDDVIAAAPKHVRTMTADVASSPERLERPSFALE